jgi:uncharacterized protein HemX
MTAVAIASAVTGAAGLGYGIYNGQQQAGNQQKALTQQGQAQQAAKAATLSTERKNEVSTNAENQKTPDLAAILQSAMNASKGGVGGTLLTGPGGASGSGMSLGKSTLLGS